MRTILYFILTCCTLVFSACPLFLYDSDVNAPSYKKNVVWSFEIESRGNQAETVYHDGYAYIQESSFLMHPYTPEPFCRLLKVNLDDGQIIWKTRDLSYGSTKNILVHDNYIYVPVGYYIYVYRDDDGSLAATVSVGRTSKAMNSDYMIGCNAYIFWGNTNRDIPDTTGLMRFDTRNIDFSKPESEVQRVEPDLVWVSPDDKAILTNFVKENGIVYFLSSNRDYNFGYGEAYLAAIDAETSVFKWKKALPHVFGFRRNSLVLNGDYLNVIDMVPSCYNKNTGESIYENEDRDMEHVYEVPLSAASYLKGITLYDNKLYYTNGMHSFASSHNPNIPKEFIKNVICVDALTGKLIWGNLVPRGGAIYTFPVVINGKAVIATDNGLRVYNALTGELLGVDKTINNWGDEVNYAYNDLFIFVDKDSSFLRSRLTAIRIDQGN